MSEQPQVRIAQRVGPAQVGQRVVLRRRLPDGGAGDLLGDLVRWDVDDGPSGGAQVTVRTRAGDVTVAASDVLGGKPVPAAPPRRGRPHRTIDWRELEEVAAEGWKPIELEWLPEPGRGWRLRAADGFTGRANSALAVGDPGLPLPDALDRVERWYGARGLPSRVAVPWPLSVRQFGSTDPSADQAAGIDTDLDHELARRGYRLEAPTLVLTASAREVEVATTPMAGKVTAPTSADGQALELRLTDEPDDAWLAVYHYRGQQLPAVARRLLLSAPRQAFASLRDHDGRAVAVARAASARGWTGITAMEVEGAHRRRGLARHLLGQLARWAVEGGDESLYLQVVRANAPARALYESAGFAPHHGYHYRVGYHHRVQPPTP